VPGSGPVAVHGANEPACIGRLVDLSVGGMRLVAATSAAPGDSISIGWHMRGCRFFVAARVLRVAPDTQRDYRRELAVVFDPSPAPSVRRRLGAMLVREQQRRVRRSRSETA